MANIYKARFKFTRFHRIYDPYCEGQWEDFQNQYGIVHYRNQMNHWESWVEIDFKNEKYYNMFLMAFSEYL